MRLSDFIRIIECQLNVSNINSTLRFKEDLGADSLDMVELIMNLEDHADIEFPDILEAEESATVSDLFLTMMKIVGGKWDATIDQA